MPTIDTPFIMELRPGEELKLAHDASAENEASAALASSNNAFAKNTFQAWVSSISFVEEVDVGADQAVSTAKPPHGHKHSVIRVSLVAHLLPSASDAPDRKRNRDGASTSASASHMKTVTLVSCNFSASAAASGDAASSASSTSGTTVESCIVFKSPLAFHSKGSIEHLSVVAEDMATTAGSSGSSGSVKRYQGARRFAVRLQGLQQTVLTKEQVLLLAKQ